MPGAVYDVERKIEKNGKEQNHNLETHNEPIFQTNECVNNIF